MTWALLACLLAAAAAAAWLHSMDTGTIAEAITKAVARDGPDPDENMRLAFELCVRPLLLCPFTHCMARRALRWLLPPLLVRA